MEKNRYKINKTYIIMEKCSKCGQKNGVHKMGCETRKITINIEMTPKERAANYMRLKKGFKQK